MGPTAAADDRPSRVACAIGTDLWCRRDRDGSYLIGLSQVARDRAGRVAHYRGPVVGGRYGRGEPAVSLESEKWVGHLPLPVPGTVVDVNHALESDPSLINRDPYGEGWLYRMRPEDPRALEALTGEVSVDRGRR